MLSSQVRWQALASIAASLSALSIGPTPALAEASPQGSIVTDINNATRAQSVFVSPSRSLAFGIHIPSQQGIDLVFSLQVATGLTWGAVGLGSHRMEHSLMLVLHASADGTNVTLSPRIAPRTGPRGPHAEPEAYTATDIRIEPLAGTGLGNGTMIYNGVCRGCQNFRGGYIDFSSTAQAAIFATGPRGWILSDDRQAPLRFHDEFGTFTINMLEAQGSGGVPVLSLNDETEGAQGGHYHDGKRNWASVFHAVIMVGTFVGLMPLGVLILRVGQWVRWHGANQALAMILVLVGMALGVYSSLWYNRSKGFRSPHQVIGLLVVALVATQFFLGFFHHKIYKRTQRTTKLAAPHVWLGRLVIILGVINAFLGFRLAQVPNYNYVLAGLVIAVVPVCLFVLLWHRVFRRQRASRRARDEAQGIGIGYQTEPWRDAPPAAPGQGPAHGYHTPAGSPPKYEDIQGAIGLRDMGPSASSSANKERSRGGRNDIGAEATPREFA